MRIRPFLPKDEKLLKLFATAYPDGKLETPHGFDAPPFVETAVAVRESGTMVASLTKTLIVALDPFLSDPAATPAEKAAALRQLSVALEYSAQKDGAAEVFTAVPEHLTDYHKVLLHNGWIQTAEKCLIFRKSLIADGGVPSSSAVD